MLTTRSIDFRKGHNSLTALLKGQPHKDRFTGAVFVFPPRTVGRLSYSIGMEQNKLQPASSWKSTALSEALVAQVLVSKYADHLALYRQTQILQTYPC